jgi:hypothetical protein
MMFTLPVGFPLRLWARHGLILVGRTFLSGGIGKCPMNWMNDPAELTDVRNAMNMESLHEPLL